MDHLWSPWRYQYVSQTGPAGGCIFCVKPAENRDDENFILFRGEFNFVLLNIYPYTTGHLMIAPYEHIGCLEPASEPILNEMIQLARRAEVHLRGIYNAHGLNVGMNIGASAGAGVPGHIHLHVLPRWSGDVNFMTSVAETRVLPESLETSFAKLKKAFQG